MQDNVHVESRNKRGRCDRRGGTAELGRFPEQETWKGFQCWLGPPGRWGRAETALEGPAGWVDWAGKFLSGALGRGTRDELGDRE